MEESSVEAWLQEMEMERSDSSSLWSLQGSDNCSSSSVSAASGVFPFMHPIPPLTLPLAVPEDGGSDTFMDPVLQFISDMLVDEETTDDSGCMLHDCGIYHALVAQEDEKWIDQVLNVDSGGGDNSYPDGIANGNSFGWNPAAEDRAELPASPSADQNSSISLLYSDTSTGTNTTSFEDATRLLLQSSSTQDRDLWQAVYGQYQDNARVSGNDSLSFFNPAAASDSAIDGDFYQGNARASSYASQESGNQDRARASRYALQKLGDRDRATRVSGYALPPLLESGGRDNARVSGYALPESGNWDSARVSGYALEELDIQNGARVSEYALPELSIQNGARVSEYALLELSIQNGTRVSEYTLPELSIQNGARVSEYTLPEVSNQNTARVSEYALHGLYNPNSVSGNLIQDNALPGLYHPDSINGKLYQDNSRVSGYSLPGFGHQDNSARVSGFALPGLYNPNDINGSNDVRVSGNALQGMFNANAIDGKLFQDNARVSGNGLQVGLYNRNPNMIDGKPHQHNAWVMGSALQGLPNPNSSMDARRVFKVEKPSEASRKGGEAGESDIASRSCPFFDMSGISYVQNDALKAEIVAKMYDGPLPLCGKSKAGAVARKEESAAIVAEAAAVDLRSLLVSCAQEVGGGDVRKARGYLDEVYQHASSVGSAMQRLALYFAEALSARLSGAGPRQYMAMPTNRPSGAQVLKAYRIFVEVCPFLQLSHYFANQTILKAVKGAPRVHIIDYGIMLGLQWPCLISRLAERKGGPPVLRITGIDCPQPTGSNPASYLEETGKRLAEYAKTYGVPFEYHAIASRWESVQISDLNLRDGEVLIVNCMHRLRHLMDESVGSSSPRDTVFSCIRRMNPKIFTIGILNAAFNAPFFVSRFREALYFYSSLFDMVNTLIHNDSPERVMLEKVLKGREILNVVACEGAERVERPETYRQWQARIQRAGFELAPLDLQILNRAQRIVKTYFHNEFMVEEGRKWMLLGWKGRIIHALSAWHPCSTALK